MRQRSYVIFFLLFLQSYAEEKPPVTTVPSVDLLRYSGKWYEIARFPFWQQKGCHNTTATYSLNDDNTIKVVNHCFKGSFEGKESRAVGKAKIGEGASKLKVRFFFLAPWGDYWIIRLGRNYEYAVVSQPTRRYLWILSRTPYMNESVYEGLVMDLKKDHFPVELLEKTPQSREP